MQTQWMYHTNQSYLSGGAKLHLNWFSYFYMVIMKTGTEHQDVGEKFLKNLHCVPKNAQTLLAVTWSKLNVS